MINVWFDGGAIVRTKIIGSDNSVIVSDCGRTVAVPIEQEQDAPFEEWQKHLPRA